MVTAKGVSFLPLSLRVALSNLALRYVNIYAKGCGGRTLKKGLKKAFKRKFKSPVKSFIAGETCKLRY